MSQGTTLYAVVTLWQGLYQGVKIFTTKAQRDNWYRRAVRKEVGMPHAPWPEVEAEYDEMKQFGQKFYEYQRDEVTAPALALVLSRCSECESEMRYKYFPDQDGGTAVYECPECHKVIRVVRSR